MRLHGIKIEDLANEPDPMSLDEEVVIGLVGNFYESEKDTKEIDEMTALEEIEKLKAKVQPILDNEEARIAGEKARVKAELQRQKNEEERENNELERLEKYPPDKPEENLGTNA